jgi:hypothetical protein
MMKLIRQIERNINSKMKQIRSGKITMAESKIGNQFNRLKDLDEASYEKLLKEYVKMVNDLKED